MLVEAILGYKSSWRILSLLLETPRKPVSRKELLQLTRLGNAPLSRGLDRFQKANIITLEKRGNKEFYYINEKQEIVMSLYQLWKQEQKSLRNLPYPIAVILSEFLRSFNDASLHTDKVFLFGSHAKGTASTASDIDIAIIFEGKYEEVKITKIVRKIERQFQAAIQVHCFTSKAFAAKSALVEEIKRDGINLLE